MLWRLSRHWSARRHISSTPDGSIDAPRAVMLLAVGLFVGLAEPVIRGAEGPTTPSCCSRFSPRNPDELHVRKLVGRHGKEMQGVFLSPFNLPWGQQRLGRSLRAGRDGAL